MATNKKSTATAAPTETTQPAAPAAAAAEAVPAKAEKASPPAAKAPAAKKPAAKKPAVAKAAKPLDPAVQASKEALAKALEAAKAVKITKPLGKPAKAVKVEKPVKVDKAPKAKKPKLVRDSFTMPEGEYEQLAGLKKRLLGQGVVAKKSELLRAGVALLVGLSDGDLAAAMQKVEVIKTGRPAKAGK